MLLVERDKNRRVQHFRLEAVSNPRAAGVLDFFFFIPVTYFLDSAACRTTIRIQTITARTLLVNIITPTRHLMEVNTTIMRALLSIQVTR